MLAKLMILTTMSLSNPDDTALVVKFTPQDLIQNIVIMPESASLKAGGGKQFCAYARINYKVYGVSYTNGKRTFDYAYCRNNYKVWFRKYERVEPLTTALYDDPFGGIVRNPLLVYDPNDKWGWAA
jgi:hypothetical protein